MKKSPRFSLIIKQVDKKKRIIIVLAGLVVAFTTLPLPGNIVKNIEQNSARLLDRNGQVLYNIQDDQTGFNQALSYQEIPQSVISAVLAAEDHEFFYHNGLSLKGIIRSIWANAQAGKIVSGGSTITQQLIKNRLHPTSRGYLYKMYEMILALKIETGMSKEDILTQYLNTVFFGNQAYGLQSAAKTYFNKNTYELSIAESAFLAGLLKAPTSLNPFKEKDAAIQRQQSILRAMRQHGFISESQYAQALDENIHLSKGTVSIYAPHFSLWVLQERPEEIQGDVYTTLDLDLQKEIESIIDIQLEKIEEKNASSSAVVVLNVHTGDILAMIGSKDYFDEAIDGAYNVALASRQPGSTLKPFTYALALKEGDTAATTVADVETQFFTQDGNPYIPRNYDYGYHGLVRYREALANSYNIAAVKVLEKVGVKNLLTFLQSAGITTLNETPEHYGIALTLGDGEVKLLELATAYGIFPRGGKTLHPRILLNDPINEGKSILDKKVAWLITDILSDNEARIPEFGSEGVLTFDTPIAAKTGTTRNSRDNWVIGFSPDYLVGVWVGNPDNTPMRDTSGIEGAGPIFHDVMEAVLRRGIQGKQFEKPEGIQEKEICRLSGKLPTDLCPHTMYEWFITGAEPHEYDDIFQEISIDKRNNLRAGEDCDSQYITKKTYAIFPQSLKKWAKENGWEEPPVTFSPLCQGAQDSKDFITIIKPNNRDTFLLDPTIHDDYEKIILEASTSESVQELTWLIDDKEVGITTYPKHRLQWTPSTGSHSIEAIGNEIKDKVIIFVEKE